MSESEIIALENLKLNLVSNSSEPSDIYTASNIDKLNDQYNHLKKIINDNKINTKTYINKLDMQLIQSQNEIISCMDNIDRLNFINKKFNNNINTLFDILDYYEKEIKQMKIIALGISSITIMQGFYIIVSIVKKIKK